MTLPVWVVKCLTPWAVGGALLVSFTASAGQRLDDFDAPVRRLSTLNGGTVLKLPVPRATQPQAIGRQWDPSADHPSHWLTKPSIVHDRLVDEVRPRALLFVNTGAILPAAALVSQVTFQASLAAQTEHFVAEPTPSQTVTADVGATTPAGLAALTAKVPDGTTPSIARAVSLSSATPAPVEPEIVALPASPLLQQASRVPSPGAQTPGKAAPAPLVAAVQVPATPRYADLIDAEDMSREQRCLAEAVYFEARSEPASGQAAVAQVVLNRVKSGHYPDSVCGVVYQNRHRYLGCQFSFACEGRSLRITEPAPWKQAVKIARAVTFGQTYLAAVGDATHYHAKYVRPHWSRVFRKKDTIGQHIFYKPRPGQS